MPRRFHRRSFARGPRSRAWTLSPVIIEEAYYLDGPDPDAIGSRLELDDAGDILPTSPQSVRTALDAENANWLSLYDAVLAGLTSGAIGTDFSFPFTNDLTAWKIFYTTNVTLMQTPFGWEPMAQLDEWRKKRAKWALDLETRIKVKLPGGIDEAPPRANTPAPPLGDLTQLVVAAGVVAAIVIFGPRFAKG